MRKARSNKWNMKGKDRNVKGKGTEKEWEWKRNGKEE